MRGEVQERKRLHEHEAVLFAFILLFVTGGVVFWGHDTYAVEYYVGSSTEVYTTPQTYEILKGEEKVFDLTVKNIKKDSNSADTAVAILELDKKCTIVAGDKNAEGGCDKIDVQLVGDSIIYPDGESIIKIKFFAEEIVDVQLTLNVVTSEAIDSVIFNFKSVEQATDEETYAEASLRDSAIIDLLINALRAATSELSGDEISATKEAPIVYVDDTGLGLTSISLNFGTLNIAKGEQSTMSLEMENLGVDAIEISGFTRPRGILVTPISAYSLKSKERKTYEVTCSPITEKELEKETLTIKTNKGDVNIGIICKGVSIEGGPKDEFGPTVKLLEPTEGNVESIFNVKIEAYDEGNIKEVAILKVYLGANLIKRFVKQMSDKSNIYSFEFDASKYSGIKDIYAEASDYSGNKGVSNRVTLWLKEQKEEAQPIITKETKQETEKEDKLNPKLMKLFVKKYNTKNYDELNEVYVTSGGIGDIRMAYDLEDVGEFNFEFKGVDIGMANDAPLNTEDVNLKTVDGGKKIIDITDEKLKEIITALGAETVVMPMLKPSGYSSPSELNLVYYHNDGSFFEIEDDDIVSIAEDGNILNIEIKSEVILED